MSKNKKTIYQHNMNHPHEVRKFPKGQVELVTFEDVVVGRATFQPGWKWSECLKPIVGTDSCEVSHTSYVLSGHMRVLMDDGSYADYGPDDVMLVTPGHDAWTIGEEPCVVIDFTGMATYGKKV